MRKKRFYLISVFLLIFVVFGIVPTTVYADEDEFFYDVGEPLEYPSYQYNVYPLDPFGNGCRYSTVTYNNANGLPTSEANAIEQSKEGFIWIGSYGGLTRYDGNNFERVRLDGINGVKSLYTDSKNRLWIGAVNSGIAVMENDNVRYWGENDGLVSGAIAAVSEDSDGYIYIASKKGVYFIDGDMNLNFIDDKRLAYKNIIDLKTGSDGLVYGIDADSNIFSLVHGNIVYHTYSGHNDPICILPDPKKEGYVYISNGEVQMHIDVYGNNDMKLINVDTMMHYIQNMEYVGGMIWFCSRTKICAFNPENISNIYFFDDILKDSSIGHVMKDYQGNFWFTSTSLGVIKVVPNQFDDIYKRYGMSETVVNSTCIYEKNLLVGTDKGLFIHDSLGNITDLEYDKYYLDGEDNTEQDQYYGLSSFFWGKRIRSIIRDSQNKLWFSTWGVGAICYDGKNIYRYTDRGSKIRIVKEKKDGSFIFIGEDGVSLQKNGKFIKTYDDLKNIKMLCAEENMNGDIILGSDGDGLYVIHTDDSIERVDRKKDLSSGVIMRIKKDRTRNIFWLVTSDSIAYMTEDYHITEVTNFPYPDNFDLFMNKKDEMWILGSDGIYVVPTNELLKNEVTNYIHYGIANGLPHVTTPNSYSELTPDGDLYISGNTGVTKVNIETDFKYNNEIKAVIPYIEADGKRIYPDKNGNFNISSNVIKLIVYGYVFNYSLTEQKISYFLEGLETNDNVIDIKELNPVTYTNLDGGEYKFVLDVLDPITNSHINLTACQIIKEKAFYEQVWFHIMNWTAVFLITSLTVYLFVHFREKKLKQKHIEEMEKQRISTELKTASDIQNNMMPNTFPAFPERKEFDIYAKMGAAKEVGGDFYDFFFIDDDHLCMIIADVSGKGVPAALFMMSANIIIQDAAKYGKSPSEILISANEELCKRSKDSMFVTVWLGILEISTGKLTAANAGHEYPIIMQPDGKFELFKDKHGFVLGGMEGMRYKEYEINMKKGTKLFLYTDGLPESKNRDGELFGTERVLDALNENKNCTLQQLLENVRRAVDGFVREEEQFDDLTMMCFEYKNDI